MTGEVGVIYTLHFDRPIGGAGRAGAQHYTGWARDVRRRLAHHAKGGPGAASITAYAVSQGIGWTLVEVRQGTRDDERQLKNNGHHERRCWICQDARKAGVA